MWKFGFLAIGIVVGLTVMFATQSTAEEKAADRIVLGALPSHQLFEDFDMSVGVTLQRVPLKPNRIRIGREQINVPGHYGQLVGVTGDSHTSILWFQKGNEIRNVVVGRPDLNLYRLNMTPDTRFEDRVVR